MIKLFSLKQQKKDGEAGGQQKSTRSAAQLRITKGEKNRKWKKFLYEFSLSIFVQFFLFRHQRTESAAHLHHKLSRSQ